MATVSLMMAAAACNPESVGAPAEKKEAERQEIDLTASLLVSAPATGAGIVKSDAGAPAFVEVDQYSYVSASPETVEGATVRIRNRTRDRVPGVTTATEIRIVDGGFDPVPIAASAGDTLEVQFRAKDGSPLIGGIAVVRVRRPPAIVRTVPRGGKKDVPLNTRLEIVFSEPLEPATVNLENVRLTAGGVPVAGTLSFTTDFSIELVPAEPLVPGATYDLVVRTGIRNRSGDPLEKELTVEFQTAALCSECASLGSLAFARDEAVFVTKLDGSPAIELLKVAYGPAWSRDGSRIAFTRPSPGRLEKLQACVADHDGSNVRCAIFGEDAIASRPTWSPDGTKIAFTTFVYSCPNGACGQFGGYWGGLHVLDIVTMQVSIVSTERLTSVSWSPDGSRIAFSIHGSAGWGGRGRFGVMKPDGSGMQILAIALDSYSVKELAWSPDGSKLALALDNEEVCPWFCDTAIGVVNADGSDLKLLATARASEDRYLGAPAWSPDMSRIAYTLDCGDLECRKDVLDVSAAGGDSRVLVTDAAMASWRPATPIPPITPTGSGSVFISGVMTPQYQFFRVSRGGAPVTDADVTVNGVPIPHYSGDLYSGNLPGAVPAGGTLKLKVVAGGVNFEALGEVITAPTITAPTAGSTFARTDPVRLAWSTPTDPDEFEVCLNCWENALEGMSYYVPGSTREFTIEPGSLSDYGSGAVVAVYAFKRNFLKSASSPQVSSEVLFVTRSRDALMTITH